MLLWLLSLVAIFVCYLVYSVREAHLYWRQRGVKQVEVGWLFGFLLKVLFLKKYTIEEATQLTYFMLPGERAYGTYNNGTPSLIIRDPELIRQVTVKDFDHFVDHTATIPVDVEPLWSKNLVSLTGDRWRYMRATLSPAFTSRKMRAMFTLMSDCAERFADHFVRNETEAAAVELRDIFTRYSNDVIATCAFGIECNSLRDRDNEFYKMGLEVTTAGGFGALVKVLFVMALPRLAKSLGVHIVSKEMADFFKKIVADTVKYREEHLVYRPDMIQLLMEARKNGGLTHDAEPEEKCEDTGFATVEESEIGLKKVDEQKEITLEDMTAQALIFFLAGFEPIATAMNFMGYELAVHPEVQAKLIEEVDSTRKRCGGVITYDELNRMKYLDMVTSEVLRKWPTGLLLERAVVKPYTIKPERPTEAPIDLEPGHSIFIPMFGIHRDPNNYPDPERFDPERFSDENKKSIRPYTYFPFGSGPRACIGSRFALLEIKTLFFHLLSRFEIVAIDKTAVPLKLVKEFRLAAEGGIWVGLKKRN